MAATGQRAPRPEEAAAAPATTDAHLSKARVFLQALLSAESFDQHTLQGLQLVSSEPGRVQCSLEVKPSLTNRYGTLHGGATATLVDVVGSLALVTQSNRSGVSLAINMLYLNPMPGGERVHVDARVIKLGRDVATIDVQLRRGTVTGQLVAMGTHTKKLNSASDMSALFEAALCETGSGTVQQQEEQQPWQQQQQQQQASQPRSKL